MEKRAFAADMRVIPEALSFVIGVFAGCHADSLLRNRMKVACEEALANVVSYAYGGGQGKLEVECGVTPEGGSFVLRIMDEGIPYNPLENDMPDTEAELEERDIGGLGVYLYTTIMDEVSYVYENGRNVLTLQKKLPKD